MKLNKKVIIIISLVVLVLGGSTFIGINILNNKNTPTKEVPDKNKDELDKNENLDESENSNDDTLEDTQEEIPEENNTEKPVNEKPAQNKVETNKEPSKNITSNNTKPTTNNKTETNKETSNKTETAKKEETKTVVKTENVTEEINRVDNKYTTNLTEVSYEVKTYSDGTTEKKETGRKDKIIFNAKTTDMLEEAKQVATANKGIYEEVVNYTNDFRSEKNVAPLTLDDKLSEAATVRAIEMAHANKFSHARPNYEEKESCFTVLDDLGITYFSVGENIAYGYSNSYEVAYGWKDSPGHYANMIKESYGKIGIGMYKLNGKIYWVQIFTN